jgi:hypothetical protein
MADNMRTDIREITRRLNAGIGPTLVAGLAGSADLSISRSWSQLGGPLPDSQAEQRLRCAYDQWRTVADVEGEHVARLWFIGSNPWLGQDAPVDAIREGRLQEVAAAARAMANDEFSG